MRSLSGPTIAALSAPELALVQLVYMGFSTPIGLNSSNWDFDYGGVTYKGAGAMGAVNPIDDSPGEVKGLSMQLIGLDASYIALALDSAGDVQGTPIVIRTAILDPTSYAIVDAPIEWTGKMDTMGIEEDGETCTIGVTAESSAVDLLRGNSSTYSDADQRALYPSDRTFEYVVSQANTPVVWPSKLWLVLTGGK